jgi:hypothetical protein
MRGRLISKKRFRQLWPETPLRVGYTVRDWDPQPVRFGMSMAQTVARVSHWVPRVIYDITAHYVRLV